MAGPRDVEKCPTFWSCLIASLWCPLVSFFIPYISFFFYFKEESPFFQDFFYFYLILERREGREKERERNINVWFTLMWPPLGTWPTTQAYALTMNPTCDPLVHSPHSIHWATPARAVFLVCLINWIIWSTHEIHIKHFFQDYFIDDIMTFVSHQGHRMLVLNLCDTNVHMDKMGNPTGERMGIWAVLQGPGTPLCCSSWSHQVVLCLID